MNKINILVVDDKKIIGDLFELTLGYGGHNIVWANNFEQAVELVQNQIFDIAFIDIVIPEKDGISILAEIKSVVPALPVIMMSGYSLEEKRNHLEELGATACLRKPFEIDEVRKVIKSTIGKEI